MTNRCGGKLPASGITASQGGIDISFSPGATVGTLQSFVANDIECPIGDLHIKIGDTKTSIDKMILVERYALT